MDNFNQNPNGFNGAPPAYNNQYSSQSNPQSSPYNVYNSVPPQNAPQYHYGMNQPVIDKDYLEERRRYHTKRTIYSKKIRGLGFNSAAALIMLLLFSNIIGVLFLIPRFSELYNNDFTFSTGFYVFYSVISVGIPFFFLGKWLSKNSAPPKIAFNPPTDKIKALLLVFIGFGGCLAANYVTSIIRYLGESVGIYSSYSAIDYPENAFDVFVMFVATAIIPALIEEYAFRGVLLSSLKKFGNKFAIIATAILFSIFHANAVQIPFAFMCGLLLGYAVLASGSFWVGVAIHAMTNALSCISSALILYFDEDFANSFYMIIMPAGIILGIMALVLYLSRYKSENILRDEGSATILSCKTKLGKFFSSPALIITIIFLLINAVSTLTTTPTTY